jgi:hypothetical protein
MQHLDDDERLALAAARSAFSPSADDAARIKAATLMAVASGAVGSASSPGNGAIEGARRVLHKATSGIAGAGAKTLLAVAVIGAAGGIGYRLGFDAGSRARDVPPVSAAVPLSSAGSPRDPVPALPLPPGPIALDALHETSSTAHRAAGTSPGAGSAPAPVRDVAHDTLKEELETLKQVDRALREQRPGVALALLDALDGSVPRGRLLEERAAARILARCDLVPSVDAQGLARDFARRYPRSVYEPRVLRACARSTDTTTDVTPQGATE